MSPPPMTTRSPARSRPRLPIGPRRGTRFRASSRRQPGSARATWLPVTWRPCSTGSPIRTSFGAGPYAVLGIRHPLALERQPLSLRPRGAYSLRGHSIGGFGSVTTNKLLATLLGEVFGLYVQAYPRYGSEKKGLPTTYYLTIAEEPIRQHAELDEVEFVPLYDIAAFAHANPLRGLTDGGTLFIQTPMTDPAAIWSALPATARADIVGRGISVWALDTAALARRHAPRPELEVRMQGVALVGVFLRVAPFGPRAGLGRDELMTAVSDRLGRFYGKRGKATVEANLEVIRTAYDSVINVTDTVVSAQVPAPLNLMEAAS